MPGAGGRQTRLSQAARGRNRWPRDSKLIDTRVEQKTPQLLAHQ